MTKTIFYILFSIVSISGYCQNNSGNDNSNSISLSFTNSSKNPTFTANPNSSSDIMYGTAFNNGNAVRFKVSSKAAYFINLQAVDAISNSYNSNTSNARGDIRNYIYYKVADNETGGDIIQSSSPDGDILGENEKTIINNCPPTHGKNANHAENENNNANGKTFSIAFKLKAGYSLSPGNYTTHLLITATHE